MDPLLCENPKCRSANIEQTTTGLFRNSYRCKKCGWAFSRVAVANVTIPFVSAAVGSFVGKVADTVFGPSKGNHPTGPPPRPHRPPNPAAAPHQHHPTLRAQPQQPTPSHTGRRSAPHSSRPGAGRNPNDPPNRERSLDTHHGDTGSGHGKFNQPSGITLDKEGNNIYVHHQFSGALFSKDGRFSSLTNTQLKEKAYQVSAKLLSLRAEYEKKCGPNLVNINNAGSWVNSEFSNNYREVTTQLAGEILSRIEPVRVDKVSPIFYGGIVVSTGILAGMEPLQFASYFLEHIAEKLRDFP